MLRSDSDYLLRSYLPLSAEKMFDRIGKCCKYDHYVFDQICVKLAGNSTGINNSDKFEFGLHSTTRFPCFENGKKNCPI